MKTKSVRLTIPPDVQFTDLKFGLDSTTGGLTFESAPIIRICQASGIPIEAMRDDEENLYQVIVYLYAKHVEKGGALDPVLDDMRKELEAQDEKGGGNNHPPGHA